MKISLKLNLLKFITQIIFFTIILVLIFTKPDALVLKLCITFLIFVFLCQTLMHFFVSKIIVKPIKLIAEHINKALNGDLKARIEVKSKDEIALLSNSVNNFLDKMEDIVLNIDNTTERLANASFELSNDINHIVEGESNTNYTGSVRHLKENMDSILDSVSSQTAGSEEVAATVTELSESIGGISRNADATTKLSIATAKDAKLGGNLVENSLKEIKTIEVTVTEIGKKAVKLGESSKQIGSIVDIINGISEKTNLLSLNAAIEASRAGEHGRGFAVVAEEVRKLADSSKEATSEIARLIKLIQNEVNDLITNSQLSQEKVKAGRELSEKTKTKIEEIINKINGTDSEVGKISSALGEHSYAINEINTTIDNIANSSADITEVSRDHNSSLNSIVERLTNTMGFAQEVTEVTDALKNLSKFFEINKNKELRAVEAIPWRPQYSVNVEIFDNEHKRLVAIINQLNSSMLNGSSKRVLGGIIDELVDYTVNHFKHEEELFEKYNYPDKEAHIKIHTSFVSHVAKFKKDLESGNATISKDLIDFLKKWLLNHISVEDKSYSSFFNSKGF